MLIWVQGAISVLQERLVVDLNCSDPKKSFFKRIDKVQLWRGCGSVLWPNQYRGASTRLKRITARR